MWFNIITPLCICMSLLIYMEMYSLEKAFFKISLRFLHQRFGVKFNEKNIVLIHFCFAISYFAFAAGASTLIEDPGNHREHPPYVSELYAFIQYASTIGFGDE